MVFKILTNDEQLILVNLHLLALWSVVNKTAKFKFQSAFVCLCMLQLPQDPKATEDLQNKEMQKKKLGMYQMKSLI